MIDNRPFHYAIAASLGLHALALFLFPDLLDPARRAVRFPPPIIARLIEPERVPAPAAPPVPREQPAAAARAEPPVARNAAKPVPPAPKPVPELSVPPAAQVGAEPAPQVDAPVSAAPLPPSVAAIEPQPEPSPQTAEAPESLSRDQYRIQLIDAAGRIKKEMSYPPLARENNWQGEVPLRVLVGANGRASVTLRGSSGYQVLDRHGLDLFTQAARALPVPPALRGKEFALEVRAIYGLED